MGCIFVSFCPRWGVLSVRVCQNREMQDIHNEKARTPNGMRA
jgi:hypothetical protein